MIKRILVEVLSSTDKGTKSDIYDSVDLKPETKLNPPAYAYRTIEEEVIELEGSFKIESKYSGFTYKGRRLTKDQVKGEYGESSITYQNVVNNNIDEVVVTTFGVFSLDKSDRVTTDDLVIRL